MQLQYTVLYCLKQLNGERTVSSIYYLLKENVLRKRYKMEICSEFLFVWNI